MDLQEYIQSVIEQIIEGINASQRKYCNDFEILPPIINPSNLNSDNKGRYNKILRKAEDLRFTIATKISNESSEHHKGGLCIKVVNYGGEGNETSGSQIHNNVTFSIPIIFPAVKEDVISKNFTPSIF